MKNRISTIINLENLNASQMASLLGIQRSTLSNILGGRNKPSLDIITSIVTKFPNLNTEWLLKGKGNPYKDSSKSLMGESIQNSSLEIQTKNDPPTIVTEFTQNREENIDLFNSPLPEPIPNSLPDDISEDMPDPLEITPEYEYHPFPVIEEGELGNKAKQLEALNKEEVTMKNSDFPPIKNETESHISPTINETKERKIIRIEVFYSDGTFEEIKRQ